MRAARWGLLAAVLLGLTSCGCPRSRSLGRSCERGDGAACASLASLTAVGLGVTRDAAEAARLWQQAAELQQSACEAGQGEACFDLAEMYERARGVPQDRARGAQLYTQGCDAGHGTSCLRLAQRLSPLAQWADGLGDELGIPGVMALSAITAQGSVNRGSSAQLLLADERRPDYTREVALLRRACDAGNARGCGELGDRYRDGHGVAEDSAQAMTLYEKACQGGDRLACESGGTLVTRTAGPTTDVVYVRLMNTGRRAYRKLAERLTTACDAGEPSACGALGAMHAQGDQYWSLESGGKAKAAQLVQRACDYGDGTSCYQAALAAGRDAPERLRGVCDMGYWPACLRLGEMYNTGRGGVRQDRGAAAGLFQKSCDANEPVGCASLAVAYLTGLGVTRSPDRARQLFQKVCDAGHPKVCEVVQQPEVFEDPMTAALLAAGAGVPVQRSLAEICDGGHLKACVTLGERYRDGDDGPSDDVQAVELFRRACDGNEPLACAALAPQYYAGRGVVEDVAQARQLSQRACLLGLREACRSVEILSP